MAALMTTPKNDAYLPNQYAQYGYNPQTAPTYSATNYSYPTITQSYTITPSGQQLPGTVHPTDYSSMGYSTAVPAANVDTQAQYSVAPTQAQNMPAANTYPQYSAAVSDTSTYPYGYSPAPTNNAGAYSSYIPQGYASPSVAGVNSMSYSTNTYNQQSQNSYSYPTPDASNVSYTQEVAGSNYGTAYGSTEQSASVTTPQQYGYNTYNTYYTQVSNSGAPQNSAYGYSEANVQPYYNNYANASSIPNANAAINIPPQSDSTTLNSQQTNSNIDLLSGLDFSVNQVPLVPQQSSTNCTEKKETPVAKVESQPSAALKTKPVEQPSKTVSVKTSEVKLLEIPKRNLLENPDTFKLFLVEVEKYEKFIDGLTVKTLNGPTTLDIKWKEIQDKQDLEVQKRSISVARCYPMKNRSADILPYDSTRVELSSTHDDYINASHIRVSFGAFFLLKGCNILMVELSFKF